MAFAIELLHPVLVLDHIDVSILVRIDTVGILELTVSRAETTPLLIKHSFNMEPLKPMVEVVGDI